jgi:hypothetical protein
LKDSVLIFKISVSLDVKNKEAKQEVNKIIVNANKINLKQVTIPRNRRETLYIN